MRFFDLPDEETAVETSMDNLDNWDSFHHLELIVSLEKIYNIHFDGKEIMRFRSYQSGLDILREKGIDI
jgi:acyl carrier protein